SLPHALPHRTTGPRNPPVRRRVPPLSPLRKTNRQSIQYPDKRPAPPRLYTVASSLAATAFRKGVAFLLCPKSDSSGESTEGPGKKTKLPSFFISLSHRSGEINCESLPDPLPAKAEGRKRFPDLFGDFRIPPPALVRRIHRQLPGSLLHQRPFFRSEEHTSELQSRENLVCRLLLEKKKKKKQRHLPQHACTYVRHSL